MFAFRKILQEGITKVPLRNFSSTSIYDIQERVLQEKSPYTEKPTNVYDDANYANYANDINDTNRTNNKSKCVKKNSSNLKTTIKLK